MRNMFLVLGLLVSIIFIDAKTCEAKLYVQIRDHAKYDEAKASFVPSNQGWGQIVRIFNSDGSNISTSKKNIITREVRLNIAEASDLLFIYVTPKGNNDQAVNKVIKVPNMVISKKIAKYNLGVNSEIIIPEQLAKVEEDTKEQVKISLKFSHPDKH
jgi:hypothetical protein